MLIPRTLWLICLQPVTAAIAQPVESLPPTPPKYAEVGNMDGNPARTSNDFVAFLNGYNSADAYDIAVANSRPQQPTAFTATVSGTMVVLKWTNPPQPFTNGYVTRAGVVIPFTTNTTGVTDSPGPGTWSYQCTVRNIVTTGAYPGTFAPLATAPAANATVGGTSPSAGWTVWTQDAGSRTVYVSASGSGSTCAQGSPCTLSTGLAQLRSGSTDWLLLKAGDVFPVSQTISLNIGSGATGKHTLISTWGTGARPKIVSSIPANGGDTSIFRIDNRTGIAIEGLEFSNTNGAIQQQAIHATNCHSFQVENCGAHDIHRAVCFQNGTDCKIYRNVFWDIRSNGCNSVSNCPQALLIEGTAGVLVDENFFLDVGIVGSLYSRPLYSQNTNTGVVTSHNIICYSRANSQGSPAEGLQHKGGAVVLDNLVIGCPIGIYVSDGGGITQNIIRFNVVMESGSVGPTVNMLGAFGRGIHWNGNAEVSDNVVAFNTGTGDGSSQGLYADGASGSILRNYIYEWTRDPAWGGAGIPAETKSIAINGGSINASDNRVYMTRPGIVVQGTSTGTGNTFWGPSSFSRTGWTKLNAAPAAPAIRMSDYMSSLGTPGTTADFGAQCKLQSKANWRDAFTAKVVNAWVRLKVGVAGPSGGNP